MYTEEIKGLETGKWKKKAAIIGAVVLCVALLGGAFYAYKKSGTIVVFTTGLKKDEIFKIGSRPCTKPEAMVYLANLQNQYEEIYGERIWDAQGSSLALEQEAKQQVLSELVQVKSMALLAQQNGVALDKKEEEKASAAGKEYFQSLNEAETAAMNVDEKTIIEMYREYALAAKVYRQIVENVNPEISDDEARTITVLQIRLGTYEKAREVLQKLKEEDADFEALAEINSEDSVIRYSFGKGEVEAAIETAAFDLGKDEVSGIIQLGDSCYILKCISTFDEAQTQLNKVKILEKRRNEAFNTEYDAFVNTLTRQLNEELWDSVTFIHDENVKTNSFFSVYNTYFLVG